jgi:hypothetical protein
LFVLSAVALLPPAFGAPDEAGAVSEGSGGDAAALWAADADAAAAARRMVDLPAGPRRDAALLDYLRRGSRSDVKQLILYGPQGSGRQWSLPTAELEPVLLELALADPSLRRLAHRQLIVQYARDRDADCWPLVRQAADSVETADSPRGQYADLSTLVSLLGTLGPSDGERSALRDDVERAVGPLLPALSESPDFDVRYLVAQLLGKLSPPASVDLAVAMLRRESLSDVKDRLIGSLWALASQPLDARRRDSVRGAALAVARDAGEMKSHVREDAVQLLVRLNDARLVGDLVGLLHRDGERDEDVRTDSNGRCHSVDTFATEALSKLTGRPQGFDPAAPRPARAAAARRWIAWWEAKDL